jgi:hypothetical protein
LFADSLTHLGPAVSDLYAPHPAGAVDITPALRVDQIDALAACGNHPVGIVAAHGLPRVDEHSRIVSGGVPLAWIGALASV